MLQMQLSKEPDFVKQSRKFSCGPHFHLNKLSTSKVGHIEEYKKVQEEQRSLLFKV